MTNRDQPDSVVVGSLHRLGDGKGKVRMESLYDTDPEDLWSALTEPGRLARWVADVDGDLRVGGSFTARFTSGWEGDGVIDVCDRPRRIVATMAPGTNDETVIEARLSPDGDRTRLVVEESGIPLGEIGVHGAGWQAHMDDLASHLGGGASSNWHSRWTELAPSYQTMADSLGC